MPFTDFTVYPDGTIGICCCDATEKTNLGNIADKTFSEIWQSKLYQILRQNLSQSRNKYPFCKGCDFVDAGIRNSFMKTALNQHKEHYNDHS